MANILKFLNNLPLVRKRLSAERLAKMSPQTVFKEIYDRNAWNGGESVSGTGSDLEQTQQVANELPRLLNELGAGSILDIPCGDCFWMQHVDLGAIHYIGADIVQDLVEGNTPLENERRKFVVADLMTSELPKVDVIFCRDCLVHLSEEHIWQALRNITRSSARYLITTTFQQRENTRKIKTGQWRPLNLQAAPFQFPEPVQLVDEKCTQDKGAYPDKMLGVWSIESIRTVVENFKAAA